MWTRKNDNWPATVERLQGERIYLRHKNGRLSVVMSIEGLHKRYRSPWEAG